MRKLTTECILTAIFIVLRLAYKYNDHYNPL